MASSEKKELEKAAYALVKEIGKKYDWKFKSFFLFKPSDFLLFRITFFYSYNTNTMDGYLSFKPIYIDDTLWDILKFENNKKKPLSFRVSAAFSQQFTAIRPIKLHTNTDKFSEDLEHLLITVEKDIEKTTSKIKNMQDYTAFLEIHYPNMTDISMINGRILGHLTLQEYDKALDLIEKAVEKKGKRFFDCEWSTGDKSFYQLAREVCVSKLNN